MTRETNTVILPLEEYNRLKGVERENEAFKKNGYVFKKGALNGYCASDEIIEDLEEVFEVAKQEAEKNKAQWELSHKLKVGETIAQKGIEGAIREYIHERSSGWKVMVEPDYSHVKGFNQYKATKEVMLKLESLQNELNNVNKNRFERVESLENQICDLTLENNKIKLKLRGELPWWKFW